jgi:peptidyl-prolyl cis-trans isomerase D
MLQTMRHLAQSWLFKGLMLILVVSFGIWGIGDMFRGNPLQRKVAKAGDEIITVQMLDHAFEAKLADVRRRSGENITAHQAKLLGGLDKVLEDLIAQAELRQGLNRLHMDVSDKSAIDWLKQQNGFKNPDGTLNKEAFQSALERTHLDEAHFIAEEKKAIAGREILAAFESFGLVPQSVAMSVASARGQQRILDVVTLANDSITNIVAPNDKVLQEFYNKNGKDFTAPEYRAVTIARLMSSDVTKDVRISDDEVKKEYDDHKDQYMQPERRDILQVVVPDESRAKQLVAAARSSGNLPHEAQVLGFKTVPLSNTEEKTLLPELTSAVFKLKVDEMAEPVRSPLGWHVVQLKHITPSGTPEFVDIKNEMRDVMQRDRAADAVTRLVNQMDDELAAGHSLEDIADGWHLRLIKIPALDGNGKTPEGRDPTELPNKNDVLKTAFGQNAGETSPIIDDKNGNYIIIRTDEVTASTLRPFDKVRDQVVPAWKKQEQGKRALVEAEAIAKSMREGKFSSVAAARPGLGIHVSRPLSLLGESDPEIPDTLTTQIFGLKKGEVIVSPQPDHQIILRLSKIVPLDGAAETATRGKVADEMDKQFPNELGDEYLKYLRTLFPVSIDEKLLRTMRERDG